MTLLPFSAACPPPGAPAAVTVEGGAVLYIVAHDEVALRVASGGDDWNQERACLLWVFTRAPFAVSSLPIHELECLWPTVASNLIAMLPSFRSIPLVLVPSTAASFVPGLGDSDLFAMKRLTGDMDRLFSRGDPSGDDDSPRVSPESGRSGRSFSSVAADFSKT